MGWNLQGPLLPLTPPVDANAKKHIFATARAAWANQASAPFRWALWGDSITEGSSVSAIADTWPMKATALLRSAAGGSYNAQNPVGFLPPYNTSSRALPWTLAGTTAYTTHGPRRDHTFAMSDAANKITGSVTGTKIRVWYTTGASMSQFTVKANGTTRSPIGSPSFTSASTVTSNHAEYTLGARATYSIEVAKGTGLAYIEGIEVFDGNESAGIQMMNFARSGWSTVEFTATSGNTSDGRAFGNGASLYNGAKAADPHLITIMLGMNDFTNTVEPDTYCANITTLVNWFRTNCDQWPSIVLQMPHKRNTSGLVGRKLWERYEHGLAITAAQLGCGYLDLRQHLPDAGSTEANALGLFSGDGIHPVAAGMTAIAQAASDYLLANLT